ncbi:hypothetical protein Tco_0445657 [Tanacetum coccineum]
MKFGGPREAVALCKRTSYTPLKTALTTKAETRLVDGVIHARLWWQRSERGRRTIQALAKGYGGEYQNEFEILINQVTGISRGLLKAFYISGLKPTLQCSLLRLNPTTLDEAFLLACATKARFTNLQLLALLRSNPTTLGEAFFRTLITEARFENENNQAVDNNVGDQEDPNVNDKQEVKKADDEEIKTVKDEERKNVEDQQVSKADDDTNNDDFDCSLPPHKGVNLTVEKIVFENTTSDLRRTRMSNFHVDRQDIGSQVKTWDPGIKIFLDDTLRAMWFRRSGECYAPS